VLFTSLQWLVFLGIVFVGFHLLPRRARPWFLLASSVFFYASWSAPYLLLIGMQLLVDWTCGFLLSRSTAPGARRLILACSIVINLSSLCVFKYAAFFGRTLNALGLPVPVVELELPLAISFYTFESMSYTIDVYRGRLEPVRSPLHLALFISWFPHLIAGPIVRPAELVPQFDDMPPVTAERFFSGLGLMLVGYSKKLLIADWLATVVEPVFSRPGYYTSLELTLGVYAYAFQIYCDFSAYTDIARGASRWFAVELPENFADPYLATSITDFWRRWHMTLSHWLRDYLYIPLGGNRKGSVRTYANLMITMLLGGLWHGASWTFVVWGGLHGLFLAAERALGIRPDAPMSPVARVLRQVLTFHLVCLAWIFFRAQSFETAWAVLSGIAGGTFWLTRERLLPMLGVVFLIALYWLAFPLRDRVVRLHPGNSGVWQAGYAVAVGMYVVTLMVLAAPSETFIYFQF
jgi:D-alanyl-lipoteichoic acid acyltransferase DltB (MBOAT superfamily)